MGERASSAVGVPVGEGAAYRGRRVGNAWCGGAAGKGGEGTSREGGQGGLAGKSIGEGQGGLSTSADKEGRSAWHASSRSKACFNEKRRKVPQVLRVLMDYGLQLINVELRYTHGLLTSRVPRRST